MKKLLRSLLCGTMLALTMSTAVFAARTGLQSPAESIPLPERQGDFYVMVNGEFVTFPDAVPQTKDNRSFLPFAAVFSQLGFAEEDMTWNSEGLITATKDDLTIALTLGKHEIVLTKAGNSTIIPTDVAPYVDPATWRTYVPFGLVADVLGYNIGWDGESGTVIIDDVTAILSENKETYDLMNKYMAFIQPFRAKNHTIRGEYFQQFSGDTNPYGLSQNSLTYSGPCEILVESDFSAFQFKGDLSVSLDTIVHSQEAHAELYLLGNAEENTLFSRLISTPLPGNTVAWKSLPLDQSCYAALLSAPDMVFSNRLFPAWNSNSFSDVLRALMQDLSLTNIDYTCSDYLDDLNQLYADRSFTSDSSRYSWDPPCDVKYYSSFEGVDGIAYLTLYLSDSAVTAYSVGTHYWGIETGMSAITKTMTEDEIELILMYVPDTSQNAILVDGGIQLSIHGTYCTTQKSPVTAPADNAFITESEPTPFMPPNWSDFKKAR